MKIVQGVGWYFPEAQGGTEVYVAALCRAFARAGHTVTVAAPDTAHDRERTYMHEGTPVYRYPIPARPTRAEAQGSVTVRGAERFHSWLAGERPDVVHLHTFVTGLGLPELGAAKACGAKTIVTTHSSSLGFVCARGTLMQWGRQPCDGITIPAKCAACLLDERGVPRMLARAIGAAPAGAARAASMLPGPIGTALGMSELVRRNIDRQQALMAGADRFVVLTEGAREILRANGFGAGNVVVNRLGADLPADTRPAAAPRAVALPLKVGYVGRFDAIKGVEVLAHAITRLDPAAPITIEFRGTPTSDRERAVRATLAAIVGRDGRVSFADAVPHDRIADLLRGYDVLCCPAVCFEGGPTVALEAQAVGTPVVGSRLGGLAEIVDDGRNGRLVPPNDAQALADALSAIARDPASTVERWRANLVPPRTMAQVACDYLSLYASC